MPITDLTGWAGPALVTSVGRCCVWHLRPGAAETRVPQGGSHLSSSSVSWGQWQRGWWETPAAKAANVRVVVGGLLGFSCSPPPAVSFPQGVPPGAELLLTRAWDDTKPTMFCTLLCCRPWFLNPQGECRFFVVLRFPCLLPFVVAYILFLFCVCVC